MLVNLFCIRFIRNKKKIEGSLSMSSLFQVECNIQHIYIYVPLTANMCCNSFLLVLQYFIQYYVIKFVSDLRQVSGFLWVLRFPPPIKLTTTI